MIKNSIINKKLFFRFFFLNEKLNLWNNRKLLAEYIFEFFLFLKNIIDFYFFSFSKNFLTNFFCENKWNKHIPNCLKKNFTKDIFLKISMNFLNYFFIDLQVCSKKKKNKKTKILYHSIKILKIKNKFDELYQNKFKTNLKNKLFFYPNLKSSDFQRKYGLIDTRGKRIKNFTKIWNESLWICHVYTNEIFKNKKNLTSVFIFLENIFVFLVYIQMNVLNYIFFYIFKNEYKTWTCEYFAQMVLIYRIFFLDRNWNLLISLREKFIFFKKHLEYTTDLLIIDFLNYRKRKLISIRNNIILLKGLNFIESFSLKTKNQAALFELVLLNKTNSFDISGNFFIKNIKKKILNLSYLKKFNKNFVDLFNYDIRIWQSSCIDSSLLKTGNKKYMLFLSLINKIESFYFDYWSFDNGKKILQHLPIENKKIYVSKNEKIEIVYYSLKDLIDNYLKIKIGKKKYLSISTILFYSKKNFIQEIKIFFRKYFKDLDSPIIVLLFNFFYYFLSNIHLQKFKLLISFEIECIVKEKMVSKFYKFLTEQGNNFFLNKYRKKILQNFCFLYFFRKNSLSSHKRLFFYLLMKTNTKLEKIKKFKVSLNKNQLSDIVFFFCAKYKVNFIILEENSFINRTTSVFLKIQLNARVNFKNQYKKDLKLSMKNELFLKFIKIISIEKDSIVYKLIKLLPTKKVGFDNTYHLIFLVTEIIIENVLIYFYFLSRKLINLPIRINNRLYFFRFSFIYKIFFFLFHHLLSKIDIDFIFILKKKTLRPFLKYISLFEIYHNEKFFKKFFGFFYLKKRQYVFFKKFLLKSKTLNYKYFFYLSFLILIRRFYNYAKFPFKSLFSKKESYNNNFSNFFDNPIIWIQLVQEFYKKFSIEKFLNIIIIKKNIEKKHNFNTFIDVVLLKKNLLYFIKQYKKYYSPCYLNFQKKIDLIFFNNSKIYVKSWKEKILSQHTIGQLLLIQNIKKIDNNFIYGNLKTGFKYFISSKDLSEFKLNFLKYIKKSLNIFPAKVVAIYPKIMQLRLTILIIKNSFYTVKNSKNFYLFGDWLKKLKIQIYT